MSNSKIVIKVGTGVLTKENGSIAEDRVQEFFSVMSEMRHLGYELVFITSGAVGLGRQSLNLKPPLSLTEKQASAAVGQVELMELYRRLGKTNKLEVAQLLVSAEDFGTRRRFVHLTQTLDYLLKQKVLPVFNENDPISSTELKIDPKSKSFGDNDKLSAIIATKIKADWLILLTDVEGVFDKNPNKYKTARIYKKVENFKELKAEVSGGSTGGRGGMNSKLQSTELALKSGTNVVIASGKKEGVLRSIFACLLTPELGPGTWFLSRAKKTNSRKTWLQVSSGYKGIIKVNDGAKEALLFKKASLLAAGVIDVEGQFHQGDVVSVQDANGDELARGVSYFSSSECRQIMGLKSSQIKKVLTNTKRDVIIQKDHLMILKDE